MSERRYGFELSSWLAAPATEKRAHATPMYGLNRDLDHVARTDP